MKKEYKIINEFLYWREKLKIPFFIINVDNKTKYSAYICLHSTGFPELSINIKSLSLRKNKYLGNVEIIFHEFGHIINKTYLKKNTIKSEYLAEKFAILNIKKYFPKYYHNFMESWRKILNKKWKKQYPNHYKAFYKLYFKDFKND